MLKRRGVKRFRPAVTGCLLSVAACKALGPALGRVHPKWLQRVGAKKLKGSTASGAPGRGTGLKHPPLPRPPQPLRLDLEGSTGTGETDAEATACNAKEEGGARSNSRKL